MSAHVFSHWSAKRFELDPRAYQQEADRFVYTKPRGLWFDADSDWQRWCEAESFATDSFKWRHILTLDFSRIILLTDKDEIDLFTERYAIADRYGIAIDWPRVAQEFAGIVIAPYCWKRRMADHARWYYGWDCASGCVWDLTAITSWSPTEVTEETTA